MECVAWGNQEGVSREAGRICVFGVVILNMNVLRSRQAVRLSSKSDSRFGKESAFSARAVLEQERKVPRYAGIMIQAGCNCRRGDTWCEAIVCWRVSNSCVGSRSLKSLSMLQCPCDRRESVTLDSTWLAPRAKLYHTPE